jgi:hypothetical protein
MFTGNAFDFSLVSPDLVFWILVFAVLAGVLALFLHFLDL